MRAEERALELAIRLGAFTAVIVLAGIITLVLTEALPALRRGLGPFLDTVWAPTSDPPRFGLAPLISGSWTVTSLALVGGLPLGVICALFISEVAAGPWQEASRALVELTAAVPSVVWGYLGLSLIAPGIKDLLDLPTGLTALTAAVVLAAMALPTVTAVSIDALRAVPADLREAASALGATRWEVVLTVALLARRGLLSAGLMGTGRVMGETMAVLMLTGNAQALVPAPLSPVRTMTATLAAEMGECVRMSDHYHALFLVGLILLAITLSLNLLAGARRWP